MLPVGVRIKVRSTANLRKRSSSGAATTSKLRNSANKTQRPSKKQLPQKKFLRTSKERASKLAKKEAKKKKESSEDHQYHVLSRRPAWADDQGVFYGIYGSYYHQKILERKNKHGESNSEDMSEETRIKLQEEQNKATQAHKRWLKKNKVTDAISNKLGKNAKKKPTREKPRDGGAGILLYVGFVLTVIGLILTVLGAGEDGFNSAELTIIGPSLVGMGAFFAFLRILTCTCQDKCARACPRLCPLPSNQYTKPLVQQTRPTTVAAAEDSQHEDDDDGDPLPEGGASAVDVDLALKEVTRVSFENETEDRKRVENKTREKNELKNKTGSLDIDFSEFEEVELNSPVTSYKKREFLVILESELILDPKKLNS